MAKQHIYSTVIPGSVFNLGLPVGELAIYLHLLHHADRGNLVRSLGIDELVSATNMARNTVRKNLRALRDRRLIAITAQKDESGASLPHLFELLEIPSRKTA